MYPAVSTQRNYIPIGNAKMWWQFSPQQMYNIKMIHKNYFYTNALICRNVLTEDIWR